MDIRLATLAIIAINALVSIKGFNDSVFFDRYKFQVGPISSGQKDRMFTSGFLHVDVGHLFFNMFTLYFFAPVIIGHLGVLTFLIVYLISLVAGSLLSLLFHKNEPYYSAVGASGAVTGVLYAAILLQPDMRLGIMFIPIPLPAYVLGIGYMLYSIYGMRHQIGNIGHSAHFGGAVGGFLVTLLFAPQVFLRNPLIVLLMAVPILVLFVMERKRSR
ncbi:rhomboid family intramembrane serine protease [Sediminicola luteus]|uniref:Rhomboid family intramembrane serine protease n=1 Tax=Sediminicola luteus TaxID=319238 RepID=A0A2A4G795_9FLAO|nr:rhomboid family intramembrane serine protease [Sediminicola luteus]PCE63824.1 rhomboid family intramembrane serine protease [Sediminicola luteus]